MDASDRIANQPAPIPAPRNANEILKELGCAGKSKATKLKVVAENAWRLHPTEIAMLNEAGLTELTQEIAELMAQGWSEIAAREAVAVRKGELGGDSGAE